MAGFRYHAPRIFLTLLALAPQLSEQQMYQSSSSLQNLLNGVDLTETIARAGEIMADGLGAYIANNSYEVGPTCTAHAEMFMDGLANQTLWALKMVDAMGKPGSDLLNLQLTWLGSYDECVETRATVYMDPATGAGPYSPFGGKYCVATYSMDGGPGLMGAETAPISLIVGICVPNSCTKDDAQGLASTLLSLVPINTTSMAPPTALCQEESLELDGKAIVAISVVAILLAVTVVGTAYDVIVTFFLHNNQTPKVHIISNGVTGSDSVIKNGVPAGITKFAPLSLPSVTNSDAIEPGHVISCSEDNAELGTINDDTLTNSDVKYGHTNLAFVSENGIEPRDTSNAPNCSKVKPSDTSVVSNSDIVENGVMADHNSDKQTEGSADKNKHTAVEKSTHYKHGLLGKVLVSFSLYTNLTKILNTHQPPGALGAVNGIRFFGMSWVILGHSFYPQLWKQSLALWAPKMMKRLTFEAIINAGFSVDTFFALSGLLLAYLSLKAMKKLSGAKNFQWGMYYFHRFWRLTPPYMLTLMITICTTRYWSNGPMWMQHPNDCSDTWWTNLLYINNLVKSDKMCFGHSWYLANDMQFFVISPVLLIPLYYSKLWGIISCLVFIVANFTSSGVIAAANDLSANGFMGQDEMRWYIYVKPWCRIGPYIVGIYTGYLLYKTNCKNRLPKAVNLLGWLIATVLALLVLYGLHNPDGTGPSLSKEVSALYNATSRTVWGACVCWVVYACATGYGGPVNTLLSWRAFIPLSRLSYCAYLIHPVVQQVYYMSRRTLIYYTDIEIAFLFMGLMVASYAAALVVSLVFEAPMMGLEKAILGRGKNS